MARSANVSRETLVALQRSAGNRALGRLLSAAGSAPRRSLQRDGGKSAVPEISVRKGSKLSADDFAAALKKNKHVPAWLKKSLGSKAGSLVLAGPVKPPSDQIWLFVDPLVEAFKARSWEITTARSTIEVTKAAGRTPSWRQIVTPDLSPRERIGSWNKVGPDETEFSPTVLHSEAEEIIYGWTSPGEASNLAKDKRNLIVIVTEIEVTAPDGRTKVFTPDADNVAEAILHEISVHAGRITQGLPDVHDESSAVIKEVVDQVAGFFRPSNAAGELERSALTDAILKFVGAV